MIDSNSPGEFARSVRDEMRRIASVQGYAKGVFLYRIPGNLIQAPREFRLIVALFRHLTRISQPLRADCRFHLDVRLDRDNLMSGEPEWCFFLSDGSEIHRTCAVHLIGGGVVPRFAAAVPARLGIIRDRINVCRF